MRSRGHDLGPQRRGITSGHHLGNFQLKKGNLFFPRGHDAGSSLGPRRLSRRPPKRTSQRGVEIPVGGRCLSGPRSGHSVQCSALAESSVPRKDWLLGVRWWCWARGASEHRAPSAAADLYALAGSGLQPAPKALYVGRPLPAALAASHTSCPHGGRYALDRQNLDLTCDCAAAWQVSTSSRAERGDIT